MASSAIPLCDTMNRVIRLEGCANFRDLGGYWAAEGRRIGWRRLFRSMTPEYVTQSDVEVVRGLDLRLVIDLRGRHYVTSGPIGELSARRLAVGNRRVLAPTEAARQKYIRLHPEQALPLVLNRMGRAYAKAAAALSNEPGPALVHCRLGKDRTGVFSAVVLSALGVSDQDIIEDYMLSNQRLEECNQVLAEHEAPTDRAWSRVASEPAKAAAMREILKLLHERYSGGIGYLRFHGMRKRDIVALQERLLE